MAPAVLSAEQVGELRAQVEHELSRLASEIETLADITRPVAPDPAIGRLSRLEAIGEKSVNEAALRSARARQRQLRAALARLDDEDFGLCTGCGEAIPFARLRSLPGTRVCVPCAEKAGG